MMMLLTGAGLLLKSFRAVMRVEAGFDPGVLTMRLSLPRKDYGELAKVSQFYRQLEARVAALPGVTSVAAINHVPLNGALASAEYQVADRPPVSEKDLPTAQYRMATPALLRTMGIPIVAGRAFTDLDGEGGAPVAIVSRGLARQAFPDRDPVGQHLLVRDTAGGVPAGRDRRRGRRRPPREPGGRRRSRISTSPTTRRRRDLLVWLTLNQFLVVRTVGRAARAGRGRAARAAGHGLDGGRGRRPRQPATTSTTAAAPRRFSLQLLAGFAAVALVMAAVGIYGVVVLHRGPAHARDRRPARAGRARMNDIVGLVLGEGLRRTAVGDRGGPGRRAGRERRRAQPALRRRARPIPPPTPRVVALLLAVTVLACLLPAWRAARVDPQVALRGD